MDFEIFCFSGIWTLHLRLPSRHSTHEKIAISIAKHLLLLYVLFWIFEAISQIISPNQSKHFLDFKQQHKYTGPYSTKLLVECIYTDFHLEI